MLIVGIVLLGVVRTESFALIPRIEPCADRLHA